MYHLSPSHPSWSQLILGVGAFFVDPFLDLFLGGAIWGQKFVQHLHLSVSVFGGYFWDMFVVDLLAPFWGPFRGLFEVIFVQVLN